MKAVTFENICQLHITPQQCFEWVIEMLEKKKNSLLPAKISMKPREGVFCNVMPCILDNGYGGVKIVTRYPDRAPSLDSKLILFDAENGIDLALMDADWITTMRTGAVAAHSILLFAKKGFCRISFLGLGNTARAALLVLASVCPERKFVVKLYCYKGQENSFAERFREFQNIEFEYAKSYEELIQGAEVVVSAVTYFADDICANRCFSEGVTVVPIHTRGFSNCDLFFDKVYADDVDHVCHFKNFNHFRNFAEVSDVVCGRTAGRQDNTERILVYNIGLAMHDIYFASKIYAMMDLSRLQEIDMKEPTKKFWI